MENSKSQIIPITEIRKEYKLSESELKENLIQLEIDLLVRRPGNCDIYTSGSAIILNSNEPKTIKDHYKKRKGTPFSDDHDSCNKLSENVLFLTISLADWLDAIKFGKTLVNKFQSIYLQKTEGTLTKKSAQQLFRNAHSPLTPIFIVSGVFLSSRAGEPSLIDLPLTENDIFITSDAYSSLKIKLTGDTNSEANSTIKDYWMSEKLLELNRASDLFFSRINHNNRDEILKNIEDWLSKKWNTPKARLIEQAALSVIPDELYRSAPKKTGIKVTGNHRSSTLTIINETAKAVEDNFLKKGGRRDKAQTIESELINKHGFTKIMATAATTIISLKVKRQTNNTH
tara:strand:- start:2185 stop:3213 length:1029 start_codon:yes stop_codon:yes gene_type:complete